MPYNKKRKISNGYNFGSIYILEKRDDEIIYTQV